MVTVRELLLRIVKGGDVINQYSGLNFKLTPHDAYGINRLTVDIEVPGEQRTHQNVFIETTSLDELAKHMSNSTFRLSRGAVTEWSVIHNDLSDLVNSYRDLDHE